MSHIFFQTSPLPKTLLLKPTLPPLSCKPRKNLTLRCSVRYTSFSLIDGGESSVAALERCFLAPPVPVESGWVEVVGPLMKGGKYGASGMLTLEKGNLDLSRGQSTSSSDFEVETGGGGGDIGNKINLGGGDGGGNGDDDDYFSDFNDDEDGEEGGLFRRRMVLEELFDRKFVDAVLNEWYKTMMDLPAALRLDYEMGLVSSAEMVRHLAINARPSTIRFIARSLSQGMSRAFLGRMVADPTFLYRLLLEEVATIGSSVWWEVENRKDRIKQEWDLALMNVLTVAACNALVVWCLAPCRPRDTCRSHGNTFLFDLQNKLKELPNNIFERSYPDRKFDLQKKIFSLFYKGAELFTVGLTAGAVQGSLSNFLASKKKEQLPATIPSVSSNALGYGAFLGVYANLRYQLVCGFDQAVVNYFDVIGVALFFSTALRVLNVQLGERSRLALLGTEVDPLVQSNDLSKAYNSQSEDGTRSSSRWFISKNAIISGLGLLGNRQRNTEKTGAPKVRRKRIVRKKVTARSA